MEMNINKNNKNYRQFLNVWNQKANQIENFCHLCEEIYMELILIKQFDKEKFNNNSKQDIDSYIEVFNNLYRNFYQEVFSDDYDYNMSRSPEEDFNRFNAYNHDFQKGKFIYDCGDKKMSRFADLPIGIQDEYFEEIKHKVNALLIFERDLKFITMKDEFWNGIAKTADEINLMDKFTACGKVVLEGGWRVNENEPEVQNFSQDKIYQSASIINEISIENIFRPDIYFKVPRSKIFLFYKFDLPNICCVSHRDAYTDEYINGETKYIEISQHTEVQKVDEEIVGDNVHELFAFSPVFATKNTMVNFYGHVGYNEVVIKNPEIIAVAALDTNSIKYAKQVAEKHNVKFLGLMGDMLYYDTWDDDMIE